MSTRKLKADKIFNGYRFVEEQVVVVRENGIIEDLVAEESAGEDIEIFEGILSPGFVNCHCHLELSHMKGLIPEKTGLVDFVFKVVTERHHSAEEVSAAIERGEEEMLRNGIVAVGDICNNNFTLPQKQKGRLQYYNFIEASGWLPSVSQIRFERAKKLLDEFSTLDAPCSVVPHAPYSVSEELWQKIQCLFEGRTVSIHNQETAFEDEFFLNGTGDFKRMYELMKIENSHHAPTGKSSLQSYFENLNTARHILLVHNTFTRPDDIDYVQSQTASHQFQTSFCLCVNANRYIEDSLPPVEALRKKNCSIVLGTDSLASNWSLNILDEIRTIRAHFPGVPLEETLRWATSNGARALQMEDQLGSLTRGKKPGVVLIDENSLSAKRLA